jgi:hypothetical protein
MCGARSSKLPRGRDIRRPSYQGFVTVHTVVRFQLGCRGLTVVRDNKDVTGRTPTGDTELFNCLIEIDHEIMVPDHSLGIH